MLNETPTTPEIVYFAHVGIAVTSTRSLAPKEVAQLVMDHLEDVLKEEDAAEFLTRMEDYESEGEEGKDA